MKTEELLISLIRHTVCGKPLDEDVQTEWTAEESAKLYRLSKAHDMAHIVSRAINDLGIRADEESTKKLQKQQMLAIYRAQQLTFVLEETKRILSEARIPHLPLKGSVIRPYYPEPWMRTSCDIDVLVHESDLDRAICALTAEGDYTEGVRDSHDVSLNTKSGVHLELHYSLIEDERVASSTPVLNEAWSHAQPLEAGAYTYAFSDAMYYFYHIAHMAKHFEIGGCGVRPFLDLWILDHMENIDLKVRDKLLETGGLLQFAEVARTLSEAWFGEGELTPIAEKMGEYIFSGGVFGSSENRVILQRKKSGSGFKYLLSRLFLPYKTLKLLYPVLEKHPWLMPVFQVVRWFKQLFKGRAKAVMSELKYNQEVSEDKVAEAKAFMDEIGL